MEQGIEADVAKHYAVEGLEQRVLAALAASGKDIKALSADDLAAFDQHHTGGKQATHDLLSQVSIRPGAHLLDVGSGIGGPARYVAQTFNCRVTGVDLTPAYVELATSLSEHTALSDHVAFHCCSALDMPFAPDTFDGAYMLHVGMNIEDKPALFSTVRRVLRPGAFFAIFDIMRLREGELRYPLAWAESSATSFVAPPEQYRADLQSAGFDLLRERDRREFAIAFFERAARSPGPSILGIFAGETAAERLANVRANLADGLIAPVEIVALAR